MIDVWVVGDIILAGNDYNIRAYDMRSGKMVITLSNYINNYFWLQWETQTVSFLPSSLLPCASSSVSFLFPSFSSIIIIIHYQSFFFERSKLYTPHAAGAFHEWDLRGTTLLGVFLGHTSTVTTSFMEDSKFVTCSYPDPPPLLLSLSPYLSLYLLFLPFSPSPLLPFPLLSLLSLSFSSSLLPLSICL